jgi:prolyl 4-hydroxylase
MPAAHALAPSAHNNDPSLRDMIHVSHGALSPEHCARLIDRFEASAELETCRREGGHSFMQLDITQAWPDEHEIALQTFLAHFHDYQANVRGHFWPPHIAFEHLRVKRYLPNGRDEFPPHVDVMDQRSARRFLTGMIYLNAPAGGETVFPHLDLSITPETGKLLVFPPLWLFPHAGLPPRSRSKYILQTYLCYGA